MGWPQYTYLALTFLGLGYILSKHGERRTDTYNIWITLPVTGFVLFLLISGGFFKGA
jgi:hypothetical protein